MKKVVLGLSLAATVTISSYATDFDTWWGSSHVNKSAYSVDAVVTSYRLNDVVNKIADQLAAKRGEMNSQNIAITSFVDLNQLNKTTNFGRTLGESFFNELHKRGFNVMDFRMQKELSVNANGEFFISRDIQKLKSDVETHYVLVGTYTQIEEGVLINARIMNAASGRVVASSRVVYNDKSCQIFENCPAPKPEVIYIKPEPLKIKITTDGCSKEECPTNCKSGVCSK